MRKVTMLFAAACMFMLPAFVRAESDSPDTWTKEEIKAYIDASVEKAVDKAFKKAFPDANREPVTVEPHKILPTTVGQGYPPFVAEPTYAYPQASYYQQQGFYSDAGSGNCANGSCGGGNATGPFRRIIGRWRNR